MIELKAKYCYRLNNQHDILKDACDGRLLYPPFNKNSSYFVLDCGAGTGAFLHESFYCEVRTHTTELLTGAWLLDLARKLPPTAIVHGIDTSTNLFPKLPPQNVSFSQHSVTNLPSGWSSRFDFVHQQLLATSLTREDWLKALQEMYRVLAPGGWIQLNEVAGWHAGPATARLLGSIISSYESRKIDLKIVEKLPELSNEAGFITVEVGKRSIALYGSSVRQAKARRSSLSTLRAGNNDAIDTGRGIQSHESFLAELEKEWNHIEGAELDFRIIYGRKP